MQAYVLSHVYGQAFYIIFVAVAISARISMIVGELIIVLSTWYKTIWTYRKGSRLDVKTPLAGILVRDGKSMQKL